MALYRQKHGPLIQTSPILVAGYQIFCYRRQSCDIFALGFLLFALGGINT